MLYIEYSTKARWNRKGVGEWTCIIVTFYNHTKAINSKIADEGSRRYTDSVSEQWTSDHLDFIRVMNVKLILVVFSLYDSQDTLNLSTDVASMCVLIRAGCCTTFQGTALRMCRSQTVVFEECQFKLTLIVVAQHGNVPVSYCFIFKYNIEPWSVNFK